MTRTEKELFNLLKDVALEDGIMSVDETKIISHAMRTAISFDWFLKKVKQDGIIDEFEQQKLESLKNKIYKEAKDVAVEDDIITKDEAALLAKLASKLSEMNDFEEL